MGCNFQEVYHDENCYNPTATYGAQVCQEDAATCTPQVRKTMAQNLQEEPKMQFCYILLGSRYNGAVLDRLNALFGRLGSPGLPEFSRAVAGRANPTFTAAPGCGTCRPKWAQRTRLPGHRGSCKALLKSAQTARNPK